MTIGELWPRLRPLCRKLALLGWASSVTGMGAGLAVAVASGTSLSATMTALQLVSSVSMGLAVLSFGAAALLQPENRSRQEPAPAGRDIPEERAGEFPATVRSFRLGSLTLLAGAVVFACAGLVLSGGPSPQSVAFCQVFLLGAAASGFTFMVFSRVAPTSGGN
jgi:hypothetical protein